MRRCVVFLMCLLCLPAFSQPPYSEFTARKLREYCAACHASGNIRFLTSENDEELWRVMRDERAPLSRKRWVDQIVMLLDWPGGKMPSIRDEPQWMPMGMKRQKLASDRELGRPTREILLESLKTLQ